MGAGMARHLLGWSLLIFTFCICGCVSKPLRLPQSVSEVYKNIRVQQGLQLAASNNILFHIPSATLKEIRKTEVDQKCRYIDGQVWDQQLIKYLAEFEKYPEIMTKFHILEIKRGDKPQIVMQKDLDGAVVVSIEFVKMENRENINYQTKLPCKASVADYLGKELIKTDYDFPPSYRLTELLKPLPDRSQVPRLSFNNTFLFYLAERGAILKFDHEMSFDRHENRQYVFADMMNQLSQETNSSFYKYLNYWFQQITLKSEQAQLIQFFALLPTTEQKMGIRVESEGDTARRFQGHLDLTYLYGGYSVEDSHLKFTTLGQLDMCLKDFAESMATLSFRKPASIEKESFLYPGFSCQPSDVNAVQPPQ